MNTIYTPLWELMDAFSSYPFGENRVTNTGLKSIVKRPHNLVDVKDDNGNIVAQRLEVVTTPFKKEDVKVTISDNVLSVSCGSQNIEDAENEDVVYRGISSQSYSFALKLAPSVDQTKITAENKDGMLKINLPSKETVASKPREIEITVA